MSQRKTFALAALVALILPYQNCAPSHLDLEDMNSSSSSSGVSNDQMADAFAKTLQPHLRSNCAACHGISQQPLFAVADAESAMNAIFRASLISLPTPASSKMVKKISGSHNGFGQAMATQLQQAIEDWAEEIAIAAPTDGEKPSILITRPGNNQILSGSIELAAQATDNVALDSVQFYLDEIPFGPSLKKSPFTASLNTETLANGAHTVTAEATDTSGNFARAISVDFVVQNATAPTVNPNANFAYISKNILAPKCIACHGASKAESGVRYDSYSATLKTVRSSASQSKFFTEINSGSMPEKSAKLAAAQIQAVRDWIELGAPNN